MSETLWWKVEIGEVGGEDRIRSGGAWCDDTAPLLCHLLMVPFHLYPRATHRPSCLFICFVQRKILCFRFILPLSAFLILHTHPSLTHPLALPLSLLVLQPARSSSAAPAAKARVKAPCSTSFLIPISGSVAPLAPPPGHREGWLYALRGMGD